jgi:hypothetical protein
MRFVSNKKVRIDIDPTSYVMVRAKMSAGVQAAVQRDVFRFQAIEGGDKSLSISPTGQMLALLVHNILSWHGPAFLNEDGKVMPCNRESIEALDLSDPDTERVFNMIADEIGKLNMAKAEKVPEGEDDPGFLSDGNGG